MKVTEYYGWFGASPDFTEPSAGSWSYGYWDPNIGYGYANPENYLSNSVLGIISNDFEQEINFYPNPTKDILTIKLMQEYPELSYSVYNMKGQMIKQKNVVFSDLLKINLTDLNSGIYIIKLAAKKSKKKAVIRVIKE